MFGYDRTNISEDIDIYESSNSPLALFQKNTLFIIYFCVNSCHYLVQKRKSFDDASIFSVEGKYHKFTLGT